MTRPNFDAHYYQRFYGEETSRAVSPEEQQRQGQFIAAYLRYLEAPVDDILDLGCGLGVLLRELGGLFPEARTTGVEFSEYLCTTYGWQPGSVVDYRAPPHDLVICTDVLGYLSKGECETAIRNLARLTRTALYLSVLTRDDLGVCDQAHTDMRQKLRWASWYREHLSRHFVSVGGGLFLKKPLTLPVWRLERA